MIRFLSVTLLGFLIGCSARQDGAPQSECPSLMPEHSRIESQENPSPFTVSAVKIGRKIQVSISSPVNEEFEGFVIQARYASDNNKVINGEFTSSQIAKTIDCSGGRRNTLTHTTPTPKTEVVTEWTPNENINEDIVFKATVLKTFDKFWTDIHSLPVKMDLNEPMFLMAQESNSQSMYDGCFDTKGCFGLPSGCVTAANCQVLLTYSKSPEGIKFNMYGLLDSSKYMAMALSDDDQMGNDSVTECLHDGDKVVARFSYNEAKKGVNSGTTNLTKEQYNSSFNDSLLSCSWITPYISRLNHHDYYLDRRNYYLLLATGPVESGNLKYHTARISTRDAVNFTAIGNVEDFGEETGETLNLTTSTEEHTKSTTVAPNETSTGGGSQSSLNLLLLAVLGLFYVTKGHLHGYFSRV